MSHADPRVRHYTPAYLANHIAELEEIADDLAVIVATLLERDRARRANASTWRKKGREEAARAVEAELLEEEPSNESDLAYNRAIHHAIAAARGDGAA